MEHTPFNEFEDNNLLFYTSFPFLFMLGNGLKKKGTLSTETIRHLMLQFTARFSNCERLIFLLFDQLQRHSAARVVASRVKCNQSSFDAFAKWVSDPTFSIELQEAAKNPAAESSLKLLQKLNKHIKSTTSMVPYTVAQRSASIKNLMAMRYMYGMPSIFFTYAPDYVYGKLNLRMSISQKENEGFPANGFGLTEALQQGDSIFHDVPIAPHNLAVLNAKGPVAAAEYFRLLTESVFHILLGTPAEHCSKRTEPLPARKRGVFGVPIASFGTVEEQGRGSLHLHVVCWGGLPGHLLQSSATFPVLIDAVAEALNGMVKAEVDPLIQAGQLINQINRIAPPRPCLITASNPIANPEKFYEEVNSAAIMCNCHSHTETCHKGKIGKICCRCRRPQGLVSETSCVQIEAANGINNQASYNVLEKVQQPLRSSLKSRNISKLPIPERDKRLVMWELMRRLMEKIRDEDSSNVFFLAIY